MLIGFGVMAWAISAHRIFHLQEMIQAALRGLCLAVATIGLSLALHAVLPEALPATVRLVGSLALAIPAGLTVGQWLQRRLGVDDSTRRGTLRAEAIALASTEPDATKLGRGFEALLARAFEVPSVQLLPLQAGGFGEGALRLEADDRELAELAATGWATPESLERRRPSPARQALADWLQRNELSAALTIPHGSATPTLLVVLARRRNEWPVTFPEIERLTAAAELMDNILGRARLATQAALQAKTEHLAMMSRGLAHDLKNLLTPVASFLEHAEGQCAPGSIEAEVHAEATRSVATMSDYVRQALFFAQRLEPRLAPVDGPRLRRQAMETVRPRAERRGVRLLASADPHPPLVADEVLLQRLLANLLANAIDASPPGAPVSLRAGPGPGGGVRLTVEDEGTGIPREHVERLFDPYFTTKDVGSDVRGFGLGLTICQKIAHLHHGTIRFDLTRPRGTAVIVDLPALPATPVAT